MIKQANNINLTILVQVLQIYVFSFENHSVDFIFPRKKIYSSFIKGHIDIYNAIVFPCIQSSLKNRKI